MTWITILLMAVYTGAAIGHNVWRNRSRYAAGQGDPYSSQWHRWQAGEFATVLAFTAVLSWRVAVVAAPAFWIAFDGLNNLFTFSGKKFFYVGTTAAIDKFFQKCEYPERNMAVAKLLLLIIAVSLSIFL